VPWLPSRCQLSLPREGGTPRWNRVNRLNGAEVLESWGPLHKVRLESGESVEARAHTTIKYDEDFKLSDKELQ